MKTIKIIDLLNKIANDKEVPNNIKYENTIYYFDEEEKRYLKETSMSAIGISDDYLLDVMLNDEVEIIEEKKIPEKITIEYLSNSKQSIQDDIIDKFNQLIDYLESKETGE